MKSLHIGPGRDKLEGFETLDIRPGCTYQADASMPLPSGNYDLIYASHVIEHIPWWKTVSTLSEWRSALAVGGRLEVWTVNALFIAQTLLSAEIGDTAIPDKWRRHNSEENIYRWVAGRIFAYGSEPSDPNWHKALFTPKYLQQCFAAAGFIDNYQLDRSRVRGKDHGLINLGWCGIKS